MANEQTYSERMKSFYDEVILPGVKHHRTLLSRMEKSEYNVSDLVRNLEEAKLIQWEMIQNQYLIAFPEIKERVDNSENSQ